MSSEVVIRQPGEVARQSGETLSAIMRVAMAPEVDVSKMQALIAMHQDLERRKAETEFNAAMVACQRQMPRIRKDGAVINHKTQAVQSRYARLESLDKVCREVWERHGFAVSFNSPGQDGRLITISACVRHEGGHSERHEVRLPLDESGSKNGTQGVGSVWTYATRYLLKGIFNIIEEGEDNDGAGAEPTVSPAQVRTIRGILPTGDEQALLRWLGVSCMDDIPASRYEDVIRAIESKRKQGAK